MDENEAVAELLRALKPPTFPYAYSWCDAHGTPELLEDIRASIPPI